MAGVPKVLDVDRGGEWGGAVLTFLAGLNPPVSIIYKDSKDDLAVVDRAGGLLKKALYQKMRSDRTSVWAPLLANLVAGHNERPHVALGSAPPNRVGAGDEIMDLMVLKANTKKMERSAQAWVKSKRGIEVVRKVRLK